LILAGYEMVDKKRDERILLNVFGFIFLLWGFMAVVNSYLFEGYNMVLWYCYLGLLLIGIGIYSRNSTLIGIQVSILAVPLVFWNIDFIYFLITGVSLWGITDYMFLGNRFVLGQLVSLQHLFTLPFSLYAMAKIKSKFKGYWKYAFLQVTVMYFAVFYLTQRADNVNCVFDCLIP
jgi:hypothetical protein